jgi:predicted lipid carrier protein YhbT
LIDNLKTLNAGFAIKITNAQNDRWRIQLKDGRLVGLQNDTGTVECSFETSATTFRKVAEGRLSPQKAFFDRKVEITGDIEKALKVAAALSQFFVAYPFFIHDKDEPATLSRRQEAAVS